MSGGFGIADARRESRPVTCARPLTSARSRLVCFPHAGGSPAAFRSWASALAPDIEVWAATLPGRGRRRREPFAVEWAPLVEGFADWIERRVPSPFGLAGHSLGALIAFEVARELTRRGQGVPTHLVASAHPAPASAPSRPVPARDDALLRAVDEAYGGIPPQLRSEPELLRLFVPILRADIELAAAYRLRQGPQLACPIVALGGTDDPAVSSAGLAAWGRFTSGSCRVRLVDGGHFYHGDGEAKALDFVRSAIVG